MVGVLLTAQETEKRANYLRILPTDNCRFHYGDYENWCQNEEDFRREIARELESGTREEYRADRSKYWMMNVGIAAASAVILFGLAYLIPILFRGIASLARRYWNWLKA
jgi:hypothetical protein